MSKHGNEDGRQVEEEEDNKGPKRSVPPDVPEIVQGVSPVLRGVEEGFDIEGRERRRTVAIGRSGSHGGWRACRETRAARQGELWR